jgi:hypothetical protein
MAPTTRLQSRMLSAGEMPQPVQEGIKLESRGSRRGSRTKSSIVEIEKQPSEEVDKVDETATPLPEATKVDHAI